MKFTLTEDFISPERSNSHNSSDSNKSYKTKLGVPNYKKFNTITDIFTFETLQFKMDKKEKARKSQNNYIEKIMKEGDVHYFRQQTFNTQFLRTVKCI